MRFAVYKSVADHTPERVGYVTAPGFLIAYDEASAKFGVGPYILRGVKTPNEITAYIQTNNFKRWQDRIGLQVYRDGTAKRAKHELTIGDSHMHLYELTNNRRKLVETWVIDRD